MEDETQHIQEEIEGFRQMGTAQLKAKYREVFGEETRSNHKQFLFRRTAWRIQPNAGASAPAPASHSPDPPLPRGGDSSSR